MLGWESEGIGYCTLLRGFCVLLEKVLELGKGWKRGLVGGFGWCRVDAGGRLPGMLGGFEGWLMCGGACLKVVWMVVCAEWDGR